MMKYHEEVCTFSGSKNGLTKCDQGQHYKMFCTVCSCSLPNYLDTCYDCQEAAANVKHLDQSLYALRRALIMEAKS